MRSLAHLWRVAASRRVHQLAAVGAMLVGTCGLLLLAACDAEVAPMGEGGAVPVGGAGGTPLVCAPPEVLRDDACEQAGVPVCADGFISDDHGGCTPILPDAPCADATMALPGETVCHPLVACGDDTWSNIPEEPGTEYVDPSYAGTDSDGSRERPWSTAQRAVLEADDGDIIALAAGDYGVPPTLNGKRLRLWGRCPELVAMEVETVGDSLFIDVDRTEVHQIGIEGATTLLIVANATDVVIDRVWAHDSGDVAILVATIGTETSAVVQHSLVERAAVIGILSVSGDLRVDSTVVRNTVENDAGPGRGIDVEMDPVTGLSASAEVSNTVVRRAREVAVSCLGATCTLDRVALIDTQPRDDGRFGMGVAVQYAYTASHVDMRNSVVRGAHMFGISVSNSGLVLEDSTIDGVATQVSGDDFGDGIAFLDPQLLELSVTVTRSRIANASRAGIASFSGAVELRDTSLECNTIALDGERIDGRPHDFSDLGGNLCWCGDEAAVCKVTESQLEAPPGG